MALWLIGGFIVVALVMLLLPSSRQRDLDAAAKYVAQIPRLEVEGGIPYGAKIAQRTDAAMKDKRRVERHIVLEPGFITKTSASPGAPAAIAGTGLPTIPAYSDAQATFMHLKVDAQDPEWRDILREIYLLTEIGHPANANLMITRAVQGEPPAKLLRMYGNKYRPKPEQEAKLRAAIEKKIDAEASALAKVKRKGAFAYYWIDGKGFVEVGYNPTSYSYDARLVQSLQNKEIVLPSR